MSTVLVRESRDDDVAAIAAVYAANVREGTGTFEEVPPDAAEMAARRAGVLGRGLPWLVAEVDGAVVGYAYAGPYRPRSAYRFSVEDSVYLAPAAVGQGIGGRLLAELIERAAATGARQMLAVIGDSGNRASVALHARAGFRHVGTLEAVGFKFGRWLDVVVMQRAL